MIDHVETVSTDNILSATLVPVSEPLDITGRMLQILPYGDLVYITYALTTLNKQYISKQVKIEDNVYTLHKAVHMKVNNDNEFHHSGAVIATYLRDGASEPSNEYYMMGLSMLMHRTNVYIEQ